VSGLVSKGRFFGVLLSMWQWMGELTIRPGRNPDMPTFLMPTTQGDAAAPGADSSIAESSVGSCDGQIMPRKATPKT
jgi:hypothetical protein